MVMTIGTKIKNLRITLKLTQEELASAVGTKKQTIHKYETGIISNIPASKIKALADKLQTTPAYLMGWEEKESNQLDLKNYGLMPIQTKKFRMLGKIACGEPIYCDEDFETYIEASSDIDADFCLTAEGDSMINARIFDGDVVFIKSASMVNNGEIAAVIIDDTAMLKRVYYYKDENKLILMSENPKYNPFVYVNEELDKVRILGKAVCFMSNVK